MEIYNKAKSLNCQTTKNKKSVLSKNILIYITIQLNQNVITCTYCVNFSY